MSVIKAGRLFFSATLLLCASVAFAQQPVEDTLRLRVATLTDPEFEGRIAGSAGEMAVAGYIYDYLQSVGVVMITPRTGDDFGIANPYTGDTLYSRNIVGVIGGYDNLTRDEYLLLGAHFDSLIHPGADDNASGCAILMQLAKMISDNKFMFRRSVIIAFFGAGEIGMAGSWFFLNRTFSDADKIVAMIDLNSLGRSGGKAEFQAFTGVRGTSLYKNILMAAQEPFSILPRIVDKEPFGSDYRNFYEKEIPAVLFTTGFSKQRLTKQDVPENLDYFQMAQIVEYLYTLSLLTANDSYTPPPVESPKEQEHTIERIFSQRDVDHRATFMKGDERVFLRDWVYPYIKYPESSVEQGNSGVVNVEFVVDTKGKVRDVKIVKGIDDEIDAEVVKVVSASPTWSPATVKGEKVNVKVVIPVEFILTKERGKIGIKK